MLVFLSLVSCQTQFFHLYFNIFYLHRTTINSGNHNELLSFLVRSTLLLPVRKSKHTFPSLPNHINGNKQLPVGHSEHIISFITHRPLTTSTTNNRWLVFLSGRNCALFEHPFIYLSIILGFISLIPLTVSTPPSSSSSCCLTGLGYEDITSVLRFIRLRLNLAGYTYYASPELSAQFSTLTLNTVRQTVQMLEVDHKFIWRWGRNPVAYPHLHTHTSPELLPFSVNTFTDYCLKSDMINDTHSPMHNCHGRVTRWILLLLSLCRGAYPSTPVIPWNKESGHRIF